jgi:hypothetical protein
MNHIWKQSELKYMLEVYTDTPSKTIADKLNVNLKCVYNKAKEIGLRKSKDYLRENCLMIKPHLK